MNTEPMSKDHLEMKVEMYSEKKGEERLKQHEESLAKATLGFVMYGEGGNKVDFMYDYMKDDTDGRYYQVDYLVWKFKDCEGAKTMKGDDIEEEEKKEAFRDLITFATWALEAEVWAMDRHFYDSIIELLKIPQLSGWHKDIRTVWNNYVELTSRLGFIICEDMGFLRVEGKEYDYHSHYNEQTRKIFGKDPSGYDYNSYYRDKVEECLRKNTSYPNVDDE